MGVIYKHSFILSWRLLSSTSCTILGSRYLTTNLPNSPRETAQIVYLKSVLNNNEADWKTIKSDLLNKRGSMNEKNVDAVLLKYITNQKMFNSGYSFANYLLKSANELTLGVTNGLLNLYYEYSKTGQLSEEEKMFILDSHKNLYNKYKVLDYATCERLLHALCAINEWKKCIKILDDINLSTTPTHSAYSTLIATLFRNNKKTEAFQLIQRSLADRRLLQDQVYDEWLKYILRKYKDKTTILKYLDELSLYIAKDYIKVSEVTADRLREAYTSLGWSAEYSTVKRDSGQCNCCNHTLDYINITNEEFASLQQNVKEKLIVGSDLFLKTSPDELKRFLGFVEKTAPYDVVLDGLNIAYTVGKGNNLDKLGALNRVVDYFAKRNRKILLLGRKHMLKWHASTLKQMSQKTYSFFTENISQDDPYFITAAILSGAHTDIVSRDLLRGHRFLMKDEQLRLLFQRWQWKHQWMIFPSRKGPVLQAPLKFTPCAQRSDTGWHIPLESEQETDDTVINSGVPDSSRWLCMKQNVVKKKK